ncbi:hypothetical protein [uncultured Psychroserpens sp.]|uniref:hypothetical protein n=1 Tax=uncultured Psychroserpens sp. TaxID=255436 RepID=UPI00260BBB56|nr:hypothetical protein [uncultured Psychroserpens sp.]
MKQLLALSFIFLSLVVNAQQVRIIESEITCESGEDMATKDFDKGIYKVYSFGLLGKIEDYGFGEYYKDYVFKKYGVLFIHQGCVIVKDEECYTIKMEELLYQKYGKNMFEIARKEAGLAFKQTLKYEKIKERMDANKVFFIVHQPPKFEKGKEGLDDFILKNFGKGDPTNYDTYIRASFVVEKDGSISNIKLTSFWQSKPYKGDDAESILKKLQEMPKWKPGSHFSEVVRTGESISIPIG